MDHLFRLLVIVTEAIILIKCYINVIIESLTSTQNPSLLPLFSVKFNICVLYGDDILYINDPCIYSDIVESFNYERNVSLSVSVKFELLKFSINDV